MKETSNYEVLTDIDDGSFSMPTAKQIKDVLAYAGCAECVHAATIELSVDDVKEIIGEKVKIPLGENV